MGCDVPCSIVFQFYVISIHAPTWGATLFTYFVNSLRNFNPRTHVGCDLVIHKCLGHTQNFNPRTHVGCDFSVIYVLSAELYFNPRTHVGCDQVRQSLDFGLLISIHAPTWGATYSSLSSHESQSISIHAPTWGATATVLPVGSGVTISIHAPTWGATRFLLFIRRILLIFQSTHPRGVRHSPRTSMRSA